MGALVGGLICRCWRTRLTPRLARNRAWRARSGAVFGPSGLATKGPRATSLLTAQKRIGWPSPRMKSPRASMRTKPVSPAVRSLSERRSSSESALNSSRGGVNAQVAAISACAAAPSAAIVSGSAVARPRSRRARWRNGARSGCAVSATAIVSGFMAGLRWQEKSP
ncbi:MAG: hypothetical protein B7Y51_12475, partial [Burkholderiales bacterium 28-67-8]